MPPYSDLNTDYRADIQGLRALAILSVMLFHINKEWLPGGYIGVDTFFVISGFLITAIIANQKDKNTFKLTSFYFKRAKRILPAYFVMLSIVSLIMAIVLTSSDHKTFIDSLISTYYFGSNFYFASFGNYFAPNSNELPLLHTWSLAIEMQFYILLPFLFIICSKKHLKPIIVVLIIILMAHSSYELLIEDEKRKTYFSLLARAPEFLIGSWLALTQQKVKLRTWKSNLFATLGLAFVLLSFFIINTDTPFPGIASIPACVGTALIIAARTSSVNSILSHPILSWIGNLSYSLYLWHWPILAGYRYYTGEYEISTFSTCLIVLASLLLAFLSFKFIESAFLSFSNFKSSLYKFMTVIAITAISLIFSKSINQTIVTPLAKQFTQYAPAAEICHGRVIGDCVRGSKTTEPTILLIGDSHAAQLNIFADTLGSSHNIGFKVVTASSCIPIPGFDVDRIAEWSRQPCLDQIKITQDILTSFKLIIIAGMWQYHYESNMFMTALDNFLNIENPNFKILVLAQVPMLKSHPLRSRRFQAIGVPINTNKEHNWDSGNKAVMQLIKNHSHVHFLDFSNMALFKNAPFYNEELIYHDTHHLNEIGSKAYASVVEEQLISIIKSYSAKN